MNYDFYLTPQNEIDSIFQSKCLSTELPIYVVSAASPNVNLYKLQITKFSESPCVSHCSIYVFKRLYSYTHIHNYTSLFTWEYFYRFFLLLIVHCAEKMRVCCLYGPGWHLSQSENILQCSLAIYVLFLFLYLFSDMY